MTLAHPAHLSRRVPARVFAFAGVALLSLAAVGCVSKEDYQALKMDRDTLAETLADAQADAQTNGKLADGYKQQLARVANGNDAGTAMASNYQTQLANVTAERDGLMGKYEEMLAKIGTGPALPEALTSEITQLAAQNPDLVAFDADRGIVKFKSDVTFQSGDAEMQPAAKTVIDRFAAILNTPAAAPYELRVAGHTDNVGNFSQMTVSKGHKDNWYLSAHRAISVSEELVKNGVNAQRIGATGFADQRPVASNSTKEGRAQNRRVEVLILPTTVKPATPADAAPEPAAPTAAAPMDMGK